MKNIRFYCGEYEGSNCGKKTLSIVKELPSCSSQTFFFKAQCPKCKQDYEVSYDAENGDKTIEPIE